MVDPKQASVHTHSERNAFPVGKSIIAGILSLLLIRYIFGLIPLSYPTSRENVEFYYKGILVDLPTPPSYCLTLQNDIIENLTQLSEYIFHFNEPFRFISFRSIRLCEDVYSDQNLVFGYDRFLYPKHIPHMFDENESHSPGIIGFVGLGAEVLPISSEGRKYWLDSEDTKRQVTGPYISSKILGYFPEFDGFDESLRIIQQKQFRHDNGYCNVTFGVSSKIKSDVLDKCNENGKQCPNALKDLANKYWDSKSSDNENPELFVADFKNPIIISLFATNFSGRSIYYVIAKELPAFPNEAEFNNAMNWGWSSCSKSASATESRMESKPGQRGIIGFSQK